MNRRDYAEIKGSLDAFMETLEYLTYPGCQSMMTNKDWRKLKSLQHKVGKVQDHFWKKSRTKKELKALNEVPKSV